jgi:hypothetical protein
MLIPRKEIDGVTVDQARAEDGDLQECFTFKSFGQRPFSFPPSLHRRPLLRQQRGGSGNLCAIMPVTSSASVSAVVAWAPGD